MGVVEMNQQEPSNMDWLGWRQVNEHFKVDAAMFCQGECLLPNLLGKFYDQQQHCDVTFQLQDGSTVQATTNIYGINLIIYETGTQVASCCGISSFRGNVLRSVG